MCPLACGRCPLAVSRLATGLGGVGGGMRENEEKLEYGGTKEENKNYSPKTINFKAHN